MESHTKTMNYHDQMEIGKNAFFGEELFNFFLTILMDVISDNELTGFDIKDLISQINDEIEPIQLENIRS